MCFLGCGGLEAIYLTEGTFDREKFVEYIRDFALSGRVQQHPGRHSVMILDGARIHCHHAIIEYLRDLGIIPIFLPAYCPFFNPIEIVFGLVKKRLRRRYSEGSISANNLVTVIASIMQEFTKFDCRNLFKKCGYEASGRFNPGIAYNGSSLNMGDAGFH